MSNLSDTDSVQSDVPVPPPVSGNAATGDAGDMPPAPTDQDPTTGSGNATIVPGVAPTPYSLPPLSPATASPTQASPAGVATVGRGAIQETINATMRAAEEAVKAAQTAAIAAGNAAMSAAEQQVSQAMAAAQQSIVAAEQSIPTTDAG